MVRYNRYFKAQKLSQERREPAPSNTTPNTTYGYTFDPRPPDLIVRSPHPPRPTPLASTSTATSARSELVQLTQPYSDPAPCNTTDPASLHDPNPPNPQCLSLPPCLLPRRRRPARRLQRRYLRPHHRARAYSDFRARVVRGWVWGWRGGEGKGGGEEDEGGGRRERGVG